MEDEEGEDEGEDEVQQGERTKVAEGRKEEWRRRAPQLRQLSRVAHQDERVRLATADRQHRSVAGGGIQSGTDHETRGRHMPPRAFISFEMEDRWARDFLVQQAKDKRNDIEFVD